MPVTLILVIGPDPQLGPLLYKVKTEFTPPVIVAVFEPGTPLSTSTISAKIESPAPELTQITGSGALLTFQEMLELQVGPEMI